MGARILTLTLFIYLRWRSSRRFPLRADAAVGRAALHPFTQILHQPTARAARRMVALMDHVNRQRPAVVLFQAQTLQTFGGDVTTLFPLLTPQQQSNSAFVAATQAINYLQLIPNSYYQAGVHFHFGDTIQKYSATWRPYLLARLYYNTLTKLSNEIKVGVNGKVFGRDSLLLYAEHGTAPAAAGAVTSMIGAQYRLFF